MICLMTATVAGAGVAEALADTAKIEVAPVEMAKAEVSADAAAGAVGAPDGYSTTANSGS